jgi:hypothetical protein
MVNSASSAGFADSARLEPLAEKAAAGLKIILREDRIYAVLPMSSPERRDQSDSGPFPPGAFFISRLPSKKSFFM